PLFVGPEKGDSLLQALYVVHYPESGIAAIADPTTKRSGLMAVIEMETPNSLNQLATALTAAVIRSRRAVFFARRGVITNSNRALDTRIFSVSPTPRRATLSFSAAMQKPCLCITPIICLHYLTPRKAASALSRLREPAARSGSPSDRRSSQRAPAASAR